MGASGSVPAGGRTTVNVSVLPQFVDGPPSLVGFTLGLTVLTPHASNFVKLQVPVRVTDASADAQNLLGTWSGTWSGHDAGLANAGEPSPTTPVNGTFSLDLQSVDLAAGTAAGTLRWEGTDAYWTYTYDAMGIASATPEPFAADRTVTFGSANTTLVGPGSDCSQGYRLTIDATVGQPDTSDGLYGPWFSVTLDVNAETVTTHGNGFITHPYGPDDSDSGFSTGLVKGTKGS
jgi:hypothetical protein